MPLAVALTIMVAFIVSWSLFMSTAEHISDVFQGHFNAISLTIIAGILLLDYLWIRILVYLVKYIIYPYMVTMV